VRGQGDRIPGGPERPPNRNLQMRDVLKTNDPVLLNFAEVMLSDAGIEAVVF